MPAMSELSVERMTGAELSALAAHELAQSLNEIAAETMAIASASKIARWILVDAKKARLSYPDIIRKAAILDAQLTIDDLKDRSRMLREIRSTIQTLLRAIPA